MSLVPYHPQEGREIVLRHRNAIVVRDPASQRLEIRGLSECPACHRPLRPSSPDHHGFDARPRQDSYVDPDYFRMLRAGHNDTRTDNPPSSPIRRVIRPILPHDQSQPPGTGEDDHAEFVPSTPAGQEGSRIRREAFSPNYFKTFFVEEKELGRGGKGVVLLVRHEIDGCHLGYFACKRVPVGDDHAWLEKVLIEVELLAKLSHPNLVSYRHVWLEDVQLTRFGPSVACAFILQQYCNSGDLLNHVVGDQPKQTTKEELKAQMRRRSKGQAEQPLDPLSSHRCLAFEEIYSLFRDVTCGLAYLHAANYIHRDLKPSNCLLHREGGNLTCLISDFGEVQPGNMVRKSTGATGTISYCAPEVLRQDASGRYGNFSTKSDVFSLGIILYFMCFGRLPYHSANAVNEELEDVDALRAEITDWQGFHDERKERPDLPSKLYQLLKRLLALDPSQRPTANEVLAAMKPESTTTLDGIPRTRSASPSISLQSRRVQNLDSPLPPSTPIPDPPKQQRYERSGSRSERPIITSIEEGSVSGGPPRLRRPSNLQNDLGATTLTRYARPTASSPTREGTSNGGGLDRFGPRLSHSPEPTVVDPSSDDGGATPKRSLSPVPTAVAASSPVPASIPVSTSPPLLMAPPTTWTGDARYRAALTWYRLTHVGTFNETPLPQFVRLSIFLGKVLTIAQPCWPYMINPWLGTLLVTIAGLDLGTTSVGGRAGSQAVVMARWQDDDGSRGRGPGRAGSSGGGGGLLGAPDFRVSLLLVLVHFVVLWAAKKWVWALCARNVGAVGEAPWNIDEDGSGEWHED